MWPLPDRGIGTRLHRITCPSLVVWGEADVVAPVEYASRWPGERVLVPGAGHLVEWDAPDAVAGALQAFFGRTITA